MADTGNSGKKKVLREYTKLPDSESNSATVLVDTRCRCFWTRRYSQTLWLKPKFWPRPKHWVQDCTKIHWGLIATLFCCCYHCYQANLGQSSLNNMLSMDPNWPTTYVYVLLAAECLAVVRACIKNLLWLFAWAIWWAGCSIGHIRNGVTTRVIVASLQLPVVSTRVPTHLENLEYSWKFVNVENSWYFWCNKSIYATITPKSLRAHASDGIN